MNSIEQGESFNFSFAVTGEEGMTMQINVMQYPQDTPAITKTLTASDGAYPGVLTSAETAALAVGQWFIHGHASDDDEDVREPIKFYVEQGWL